MKILVCALLSFGAGMVVPIAAANDAVPDTGKSNTPSPRRTSAKPQDAKSHDELQQQAIRSRVGSEAIFEKFEPSQAPDSTKQKHNQDLVAQSDILCFGGSATLVPKYSVIHVPERLKKRTRMAPDSQLMTWRKFLGLNRGWITVLEVTLEQASGEQPFDENKAKWIASSTKVVVATLRGGPVSVLEPATEDEEEVASTR